MSTVAAGLFQDPQSALAAARALRGAGFDAPEMMSPVPVEGAKEVLGEKRSAIKRFTFFGAITGALSGFLLAAGSAVLYLHPTGGRPIITIPPYLIITYELTILFGILFTVLGFLISARLPTIRDRVYVPEAAVDRFVVSVPCADDQQRRRAEGILHDAGAEEVRDVEEASGT